VVGGDAAGGSAGLARLIDKAGEELLFDFKHYLGTDLLDVLRDGSGLTPRLALAYARQLPLESATVAALRGGPEFRGWNHDRYMMADLIDVAQIHVHATVSANSKKRPKAPERYERPEARKRQRSNPNSFRSMAAARLTAIKNRKANSNGGTRD
jgi:hypothetical protein